VQENVKKGKKDDEMKRQKGVFSKFFVLVGRK
jgi:hypothetical protein